jgi:hypothetical protein
MGSEEKIPPHPHPQEKTKTKKKGEKKGNRSPQAQIYVH